MLVFPYGKIFFTIYWLFIVTLVLLLLLLMLLFSLFFFMLTYCSLHLYLFLFFFFLFLQVAISISRLVIFICSIMVCCHYLFDCYYNGILRLQLLRFFFNLLIVHESTAFNSQIFSLLLMILSFLCHGWFYRYFGVGLMHLPSYGIFALIVRLKRVALSRSFPDSYQSIRWGCRSGLALPSPNHFMRNISSTGIILSELLQRHYSLHQEAMEKKLVFRFVISRWTLYFLGHRSSDMHVFLSPQSINCSKYVCSGMINQ